MFQLPQPVPVAVQAMPVFIGHGESDPLVPVSLARQTAEGLKKSGEAPLLSPPSCLDASADSFTAS